MTRGRKATPPALRVVLGNPGKRKIPRRKPSKKRRLHATHALTSYQKKVWARVIKRAPYGLLQPIDSELVTQFVVAADLYERAACSIDAAPLIVRTPNGFPTINPWLSILNKQQSIMQSIASELGFSPTSRGRLGVEEHDDQIDEIEREYFGDF